MCVCVCARERECVCVRVCVTSVTRLSDSVSVSQSLCRSFKSVFKTRPAVSVCRRGGTVTESVGVDCGEPRPTRRGKMGYSLLRSL